MTKKGKLLKLDCEIGHSYSPESFTEAQNDALEPALWIALRTLRERVTIQQTLARNERHRGRANTPAGSPIRPRVPSGILRFSAKFLNGCKR